MADPLTKRGDADSFLSRWSRRKHAAAREADAPAAAPVNASTLAGPPAVTPPVPAGAAAPAADAATAAALPPVESLTFESDFAAFLRPGVDPALRRTALRTLLRDPHFNVMDGLDVYIDDYTKPSPLAAATIAGMVQARYIFAPPPTRVNADGVVEDVPEDEVAAAALAAAGPVAPQQPAAGADPTTPAPVVGPAAERAPATSSTSPTDGPQGEHA